MKIPIYITLLLFLTKLTTAQNWVPLGSGLNGSVQTLTTFNGDLYVGGTFTTAGGITVNRVAKWDGTNWSALGTGMDNTVFELVVYNGELYAGGNFVNAGGTAANRIAKWNGSTWSALGSGVNSDIFGSTVHNGSLYVCGLFTTAGGQSANRVAKWDGTAWSALGTGLSGSGVRGLAVYNGEIYAGGIITISGGSNIAKWDGVSWSAVGTGTNGTIRDALEVYNGELYIAGEFSTAGGISANRIAKWDGSSWSALDTGLTGGATPVGRGLGIFNDELFVGGLFTNAGGIPVENIAKWNGTSWSSLGTGMNDDVVQLCEYNLELYAGGEFITAGGNTVNYIAKWVTCDLPSQPGPISGNTTVCSGSSQTYSINSVTGAISYTWTLPSGWTGSSTTNSITTTVGNNSGNVSVTANNGCGSSPAQTLVVTVNLIPVQPGTISGSILVCQGSSQTYSITAVGGATSYTWTLPSGWTGSSTTTSITATVGSNSGNISVTANNSCGNSTAQTLVVTVVNSVPAQPGSIGGNNSVCQGSSQTYSISAVSGSTGYTWILPSGWTGSSSTTSITAMVGASNGNISVTANNSCGSSPAQTLAVTVNTIPAQPGTISGNNSVCQGSSQTYSVSPVTGATTYTWILPSGWTGSSTTTSITATVGANSGNISVIANNSCGSSSAQILSVTVNPFPGQPGAISGSTSVCQGSSQTYSINAVSGATGYTWTLPSGWTGSSTTTSITATVGTNSGNISVAADNSCGSSTTQTLSVTVNTTPAQPGTISGNNSVCPGSFQTYSISAVSGATTYTWTLPSGWTGSSTTTSITATVGANGGNISVIANNSCGSSAAQTLTVTIINSIPTQPGTISGNNVVCQGDSQTYSIDAVSGATNYTWTLPSGWTGTSSTISITATVGASGGNISVIANNSCGSSPAQNLPVTVDPVPAQPGTIIGNNAVCQGSSQTYAIGEVSGATSYTWTLPSGWSGSSTTTSIATTVGANEGNISVTANNSCGSSPAQILVITVSPVPAQPGVISGNNGVCQGSSQTYFIAEIPGATSYTWTIPSGWTGSSTTASIIITVGTNSDSISVTADNNCGSSVAQTFAVTVNSPPAQPETINGNTFVCPASSQIYSVNQISGADSYTWTLPSGWTGNSTTTSITTTVGSSGGNILVIANNNCGSSGTQILGITVVNSAPSQPGAIIGGNSVCQGSAQTYSIEEVSGASSYTWTLPPGWSGSSGTTSISAIVGADGGNISVIANNGCGSSTAQTIIVNVNPVPAEPGTITGNITVTVGQTLNYSISPVNGATGYNWSLNGGGNIIMGMNTESISINWLTAGDYILSISATNSCGMSSIQTLNITVSLGTGVNDPYNTLQIKINPNPADDHFEVQTNLSPGVISVMDVSGKVVLHQVLKDQKNTIHTGSLMNGIYFIRLQNGNGCYSKSIEVIH